MSRFRYSAHCVKETYASAAKKRSGDCCRTEDEEHDCHFVTEAKEVSRMEEAHNGGVKDLIKELVREFSLSFAEDTLQLVTGRARKEVGNVVRLVSDAKFQTSKLCQYMKKTDDCKRILDDSKSEKRPGQGSIKKFFEIESGLLVSGAVLYKKDALAVLRRQMAMPSSQDALFSSQEFGEKTRHLTDMLHS